MARRCPDYAAFQRLLVRMCQAATQEDKDADRDGVITPAALLHGAFKSWATARRNELTDAQRIARADALTYERMWPSYLAAVVGGGRPSG